MVSTLRGRPIRIRMMISMAVTETLHSALVGNAWTLAALAAVRRRPTVVIPACSVMPTAPVKPFRPAASRCQRPLAATSPYITLSGERRQPIDVQESTRDVMGESAEGVTTLGVFSIPVISNVGVPALLGRAVVPLARATVAVWKRAGTTANGASWVRIFLRAPVAVKATTLELLQYIVVNMVVLAHIGALASAVVGLVLRFHLKLGFVSANTRQNARAVGGRHVSWLQQPGVGGPGANV